MFDQFVDRIEPGGFLVVCADDPGAGRAARRLRPRRPGPRATAVRQPRRRRRPADRTRPRTVTAAAASGRRRHRRRAGCGSRCPGDHMVLNAAAALAAGVELGRRPRRHGRRVWPPTPGCGGGSSSRARPPGSPSTTTTPTTRPRSRRSCRRPRAWSATGPGWWWCSSRTCTRGPGRSPTRSARRSAAPTMVVVLDVYGAREDPEPGRQRRAGRRRGRRCRAGAGAVRAALVDGARPGGRAAPAGRHRDHHGRRRRHRARPGDPAELARPR